MAASAATPDVILGVGTVGDKSGMCRRVRKRNNPPPAPSSLNRADIPCFVVAVRPVGQVLYARSCAGVSEYLSQCVPAPASRSSWQSQPLICPFSIIYNFASSSCFPRTSPPFGKFLPTVAGLHDHDLGGANAYAPRRSQNVGY
jgi:hypothetical protein